MIRLLILKSLLFLIFLPNEIIGQNFLTRQIGSTQHDEADDIYADDSGNVYIYGSHDATITIGSKSIKNFGGSDNFLAKYDCSGNLLWAQTVGGSGNEFKYFLGMDNDKYGNIYITGGFHGTATVTSSDGVNKTISSNGGYDIFVIKYSTEGKIEWVNSYGGTGDDIAHDIVVDNNLNYFLTGEFTGNGTYDTLSFVSTGGSDAFIFKADSSMKIFWGAQGKGLGDDCGTSIKLDPNFNILVCGYGGNNGIGVSFDGKSSGSSTYQTGFLVKYDKNGSVLWLESVCSSGGGANIWLELVVDKLSNTYVIGHFKGSSTVTSSDGNNLTISNNIGNYDLNIVKYGSDGIALWGKVYGSIGMDQGYAITLRQDDSLIYIGCKLGGQISYVSKTSTYYGGDDYLVMSLDTSGKVLWYDYGGGNQNDGAQGLYIDSKNCIHVAAFLESVSIIAGQSFSTRGNTDALYVKYYSPVVAAFSYNQIKCTDSVTFNNFSINASSCFWDFGDGVTDTAFQTSHKYKTKGTYNVLLTAVSGNCRDVKQVIVKVDVDSLNKASFFADTYLGCIPLGIKFTNKSVGATNYVWDFDDGNVDTNFNTSHVFALAGDYKVKLISFDKSGCIPTDTFTKSIKVISSINADFSYTLNTCTGIVGFKDSSSQSTKWEWYIGNDTLTYKVQNPGHKFPGDGDYDIKLKIYNSNCIDSIIKTISLVGINNNLFLPNAFTPNGDGLNDKFEILGNLKCIDNFSLQIYTRWGEKVFETNDMNVLWEGKTKSGKELPEGSYVYIFKSKDIDLTGNVKLVR